MADSSPLLDILRQVLISYSARLSIDGGSKLLVSDAEIATQIADSTKDVRTPFGPTLTIATRGSEEGSAGKIPEGVNCNAEALDNLTSKMDYFTHAVFGVNSEDPKFVLEGLKWMKYALKPKGIAIVISIKHATEQAGDGQFTVGLEDKIKYQSKGKASSLTDVLEYAGFERGKIRSTDVTSEQEYEGKKVEAQVVLAMKWDQLTA